MTNIKNKQLKKSQLLQLTLMM